MTFSSYSFYHRGMMSENTKRERQQREGRLEPAAEGREEADNARQASEPFLRATLDALSAHIAVLDERGVIIATNEAWRRFSRANGGAADSIGTNYLNVCEASAGSRLDGEAALESAAGIRAVLAGERELFSLEYSCHSATERLWFVMRASRFSSEGPTRVVIAHENITERKLAEEMLHEADEGHRLLVEGAKEYAILIMDTRGRILEWNPGAEHIIGYAEKEVLGKNIDLIFTPEARADGVPEQEMRQAVAEGEAKDERWHLRKDGTRFYAEGAVTALRDESGNLRGFAKVLRDNTFRKQAEETLRESEEYHRVLTETASDGMITIDEESTIQFVNTATEQLFGHPKEAMVGRNLTMLMPEYLRHAHEVALKRYSETGQKHLSWKSLELPGLHRNGQEIPLEVSFGEFMKGGKRHFSSIIRDIRERKESEEKTERLAEDVRLLLESTGEGIYGIDVRGRCTFVNIAAARMLGYTQAEMVGKNMHGLVHHCHEDGIPYPEADCPIFRAFRDGREMRVEGEVFWRKDGSSFPTAYSSQPVFSEGEVRGAVVNFTDITERKRVAEERERLLALEQRARREAERASERLSFLADASTLLASSLDYQTTLARIADLAVPETADWCAVDLLNEEGRLQRLAAAHIDPDKVAWAHELRRHYPADPDGTRGAYGVVRTGRTEFYPVVPDRALQEAAHDAEHLRLLRGVGFSSAIITPLKTHNKVLGVLTLVSTSGRRYTESDVELAEELARRAAVAVENAYLFKQTQTLNETLEARVEVRTRELREANLQLSTEISERQQAEVALLESEEMIRSLYRVASARDTSFEAKMKALLRLGCERFGLPVGVLAHIERGDYTVVQAVSPGDEIGPGSRFTLANTYCSAVVQRRELVAFEHAEASSWRGHPAYAEFKLEAYLGTPLVVSGEVYGTLSFSSPESRDVPFADTERDALKLMAQWVEGELVRLRAEGVLKHAYRDLTEKSAALEAANRELEAFSYSVSHDLRAPLRGIDGFSQALLEDYGADLDETAQRYISRVRAGAQRMGELIDDMLVLSRISRSEMKLEPLELSEIARNIATTLQERQPERNISFHIAQSIEAFGDARLLRILLENLFENAWKFTRNEAHTHITFGIDYSSGVASYFIKDNGAGFDMTYAGRLFSAFQRLHSSDEFEGTGIGLATVQRVVRRHGGRVWAEAEVGEGATFYFTLTPHPTKETYD